MRISKINGYNYAQPKTNLKQRSCNNVLKTQNSNVSNVQFQASLGKIMGGVLGTAAIIAFAPAVAVVGLAGVGTLAGIAVGHAIDEKIEEKEEEKKNKEK